MLITKLFFQCNQSNIAFIRGYFFGLNIYIFLWISTVRQISDIFDRTTSRKPKINVNYVFSSWVSYRYQTLDFIKLTIIMLKIKSNYICNASLSYHIYAKYSALFCVLISHWLVLLLKERNFSVSGKWLVEKCFVKNENDKKLKFMDIFSSYIKYTQTFEYYRKSQKTFKTQN